MKSRRIFSILITLALVVSLGWWIIRDPYHHHPYSAKGVEELRFAHSGEQEDYEFWRQTISEFEQANPDVHIKQDYVAEPGAAYGKFLRRQVLSPRLPDVALVPVSAFQEISDHLEDLSSLSIAIGIDGLEATGLRAFQVGNEQRGLPFSGGNLLIFLNRRCFQKASGFHRQPLPLTGGNWTVAQFLRTAEKLTCDIDGDGQTDQFGFRLPQWDDYLPFIWSFGADLTDPQSARWKFTGPAAESAIRFYRQLATGDRVTPREGNTSQTSQDTGFLTGKTAMCVNGPWLIPLLEKSDLADEYAVASIPRGPGGRATRIMWDGIAIRKNLPPDHGDQARRFVEWTLSIKVQGRLARLGRAIPARVDVQGEFIAADPPRRKPFIDALSYSRLEPPLPRSESLDHAITRHFEEAIDPHRAFNASALLDALARDPEVVGAFPP